MEIGTDFKSITCFVVFALITGNYVHANSNLVETIQNIQFDEEFIFCPDGTDGSVNAPAFFGGEEFFNWYFANLTTKLEEHSAILKNLTITKRGSIPSNSLIRSIFSDIMANNEYNQIQQVVLLLGEDSEPLYCYEDSIATNCEAYELLYPTSATTWTYKYECKKWQANYVDIAIQSRSDGHLTKVLFSVNMDIQHIDVNQCPDSKDVTFADTALCSADISMCEYINGSGFVIGSYECRCKDCSDCDTINGRNLSDPKQNASVLLERTCTPFVPPEPKPEPERVIVLEPSLRYALLAVNSLFILLCLLFAIMSIAKHSTQVIESANLSVLELILFGAVCKYAMLILILWPPSELSCYLTPWLAELSFISMFAAIVIKIYQTIAMRKKDSPVTNTLILKPWIVAAVIVVVYMASWTASSASYSAAYNISLVSSTGGGVNNPQCLTTAWNYVTQIAEVLFVLYGLVLCIVAGRLSLSTAFGETKWYTAVLVIELILSVIFYILWPVLGLKGLPLLLATTIYQHLTVSVAVLLIFCPKFHYIRIGLKAADISDSRWIGAGDIRAKDNRKEEIQLDEANRQIQTLKERLRKYESGNQHTSLVGSSSTPPQANPRPSKTKAVNGTEYELEPLNPVVEKSNSSMKVSF